MNLFDKLLIPRYRSSVGLPLLRWIQRSLRQETLLSIIVRDKHCSHT